MSGRCPVCGHGTDHVPGSRSGEGRPGWCEACDRCWVEERERERPPHHGG